ncbi:hypothetical protein RJ640_023655 [Escallonia rubra]|uniref:Pentatricopeptide repeat-containing protein n=1 Tax=Escallonia rubra TaxID=112253 RepID=A0AA88RKK5_9ASTE|nr:hypothetical protein RJ640_023655 [Escallonia rubra]
MVLQVTFHAGLVDQGRKYFGSMAQDYGIKPGIEHYTCMIYLLGRAEQIEKAEDLICNADFIDDPPFGQLFLVFALPLQILSSLSTLL